MLLGFLRRKKIEVTGDVREELRQIRSVISRLDKDTDTMFTALNEIRPAVSDFSVKISQIYDATRLAVQNHEEIKALEKEVRELKTHISRAAHFLATAPAPRTLQQPQQPEILQKQFSDTSLNSVNSSLKSLKSQVPQEKIAEKQPILPTFETLTAMEKRTFVTLAALIKESAEKEVEFETIVRELYPNMPVSTRRSTVSNFLRRLEALGLIKRERKGRKKVIILVERGLAALGEQAFKQLESSLIRKK